VGASPIRVTAAGSAGASSIVFPECYVPGYRAPQKHVPPPDRDFLERGWSALASACAEAKVAAVIGTERIVDAQVRITALVIDAGGDRCGFQDKVQLDPSEEPFFTAGTERRLFRVGPLTFGIVICHEGWRYPETVRWAACRGAQLVATRQLAARLKPEAADVTGS